MPPLGSDGDYSAAFRLALPEAAARREYLRQVTSGCDPSYGQRVLGALVAAGDADVLVTTNFDDLIERAATDAYAAAAEPGRPLLTTAGLGSARRAARAVADDAWPLLIKLHGEFADDELKNLDEDLQDQDATLRRAVVDSSRRVGLVVAGYSGRDASVMRILADAAQAADAWPAGLWWCTRDPGALASPVHDLLGRCAASGVASRIVQTANFDELMGAVANQAELPPPLRMYVDALRPQGRVTAAGLPVAVAGPFPVLRLNALPVLDGPSSALRAKLPPGVAQDDVASRLRDAGWRGCATASGGHVLALGHPKALQDALGLPALPAPVAVDLASAAAAPDAQALAAEALTRGLGRRLPVRVQVRDSGNRLVVRPPGDAPDHDDARLALRGAYRTDLTGLLPDNCGASRNGGGRRYAEGIRLSLDSRSGRLWLLLRPFTWQEQSADMAAWLDLPPQERPPKPIDPAAEWNRERWVTRKNEYWAGVVDAWARLLAPAAVTHVHPLPKAAADAEGTVGGAFRIGRVTAYSRQAA
jgi:hypothetical protein